jgi:hypothetical protein
VRDASPLITPMAQDKPVIDEDLMLPLERFDTQAFQMATKWQKRCTDCAREVLKTKSASNGSKGDDDEPKRWRRQYAAIVRKYR